VSNDFVPDFELSVLASNFVVDDDADANSDDESKPSSSSLAAAAVVPAAAAPAAASSGAVAAAAAAASAAPSAAAATNAALASGSGASGAGKAAVAAGSSSLRDVPDLVRTFVEWWFAQFRQKRTHEIHAVYELHFGKLTERFFKASPWPTAETIAPLVEHDALFLVLYNTLWFKHLAAKLPVSLDARADAHLNTLALFDFVLAAKQPADIDADLPLPWVWYIVDSFVQQVADLAHLRAAVDVSAELPDAKLADVHAAIDCLERLVAKSSVVQCLAEERVVGFGAQPLVYALGYFAIVGAARLRCALGDYAGALRTAAPINSAKKGLYSRVIACHASLFHTLAFAHLMQRQHAECVRVASALLVLMHRTKQFNFRAPTSGVQLTPDALYALLALASALFSSVLDDAVRVAVRERFIDQMARVTRGRADAFEELFMLASVRHLPAPGTAAPAKRAAAAAPLHSAECARAIAAARRAADHAAAVRASQMLGTVMPQLRSILRLYSTIDVSKLAKLLQLDSAACRQLLAEYAKHVAPSDISFRLDGDMLQVIEPPRVAKEKPSEVFARQARKLDALNAQSSK